MIIIVLNCILISIAGLIDFYYLFLCLIKFLHKKKINSMNLPANYKFLIIIPAYNEENTIHISLTSCIKLDYPEDLYNIVVIADNCTDKTVDLASEYYVEVMERSDSIKKGKGFALDWAFKQLIRRDYDAFIILDADCALDPNALKVFNSNLSNGENVLQANYKVTNPDESVVSYALAVGNLLENKYFYYPKSTLGLSVFLRGTGMVFKRWIFEKYPWNAHSIVEDAEYSILLMKHGVKIKFIPEIDVLSSFPKEFSQLNVQRTRWASGNMKMTKYMSFKLLWHGFINLNSMIIDSGWTLLILSRPLIIALHIVSFLMAILNLYISPGLISRYLVVLSMFMIFTQIAYWLIGIISLGINKQRILKLLKVPIIIIRLILISILGILGFRENEWARTPRS